MICTAENNAIFGYFYLNLSDKNSPTLPNIALFSTVRLSVLQLNPLNYILYRVSPKKELRPYYFYLYSALHSIWFIRFVSISEFEHFWYNDQMTDRWMVFG